jgi:hypothetical protein
MEMQPTATVQNPGHTAPHLNEREAAKFLGITVEGLRTWRKLGRGPRYRKFGRCVRYKRADLEVFVEAAPAGGGPAA